MRAVVLVLFVATSALAAPSVVVNTVAIQNTAREYDTGVGLSRGVASNIMEYVDAATLSTYLDMLLEGLKDLASQPDSKSQALSVGQIIAILASAGPGLPGDACAAANAINGGSVRGFLSYLATGIDTIVALVRNPESLRNRAPQQGNCSGGGRVYSFEAAWNLILDNTSPNNVGLVNEEYCSTKRLYQALDVRSNNIGAAVTAASLPQVQQSLIRNIGLLANFLRQASNGNVSSAQAAKNALLSA